MGSSEEEGLVRAIQISEAIILPMVVKTALDLDLFDIMAKIPGGQFTSLDLASSLPRQTPETPGLIERILRYLASQSVLSTIVEDEVRSGSNVLYCMTPVSNNFVKYKDGRTSRGASLLPLLCDKVFVDCWWYHLKDAILDGGTPFEKVHGANIYEYPAKDERFKEVLKNGIYDETRMVMRMMLEKYKGFEGTKELVDVGGGAGADLEQIVSKYPNIKGINFDLPHIIKEAPPCPGVEHVGGDMFESVPKGDVILLKWILHNWGDNYCIQILKNCRAELPESGKVVLVEFIMPDPKNNSSIRDQGSETVMNNDMMMLLVQDGGKERTLKEYIFLANEAGFTSLKIAYKGPKFCIMEISKNK